MYIRNTLLLAAALSAAPTAQAQLVPNLSDRLSDLLSQLLAPLLGFFENSVCDGAEALFTSVPAVTCECNAEFAFTGILIELSCATPEPVCLVKNVGPVDLFCGSSLFEAGYKFNEGITNPKACLDIEDGLPASFPVDLDSAIPELCITGTARPNSLLFDTCAVTLGNEACTSCDVCPLGAGVRFNCTNVPLVPFLPALRLPVVNGCVGLGLLGDVNGEAGSVTAFGG